MNAGQTWDYDGAAESADQAYTLISKFLHSAKQITAVVDSFGDKRELTADGKNVLLQATDQLADSLEEAVAIERSLVQHRRCIALAYEEANSGSEVLHLVLRLCVEISNAAIAFRAKGEFDRPMSWWAFAFSPRALFYDEEIGQFPSVTYACSMAEAVSMKCDGIAHRMRKEVARQDGEPLDDGPYEPFRWVVDSKLIDEEMKPTAWRMVNYLWTLTSRSCAIVKLNEPVYQDPKGHSATHDAVSSLRREANAFFLKHGINLRVAIRSGSVSLKDHAPLTTGA